MKTFEEIAEKLGTTVASVRASYSSAVRKLRENARSPEMLELRRMIREQGEGEMRKQCTAPY